MLRQKQAHDASFGNKDKRRGSCCEHILLSLRERDAVEGAVDVGAESFI